MNIYIPKEKNVYRNISGNWGGCCCLELLCYVISPKNVCLEVGLEQRAPVALKSCGVLPGCAGAAPRLRSSVAADSEAEGRGKGLLVP